MSAMNGFTGTTDPIPKRSWTFFVQTPEAPLVGSISERIGVETRALRAVAAEDDRLERPERKALADASHGDRRRAFGSKSVNAGRDRREGEAPEAVFGGDLERAAATTCQRRILASPAAAPDRANCVDDVPRR